MNSIKRAKGGAEMTENETGNKYLTNCIHHQICQGGYNCQTKCQYFKEVTFMKDDLKKAILSEFMYREMQGVTNYSIGEVICIVNEVIDEVAFEGGAE